jgi:hypothetical protein
VGEDQLPVGRERPGRFLRQLIVGIERQQGRQNRESAIADADDRFSLAEIPVSLPLVDGLAVRDFICLVLRCQ